MFSGDGEEPKHNDDESKIIAELAEVLLLIRNKVEDIPDETEQGDEHIQSVGLALPVAEEAERAQLHEDLDEKEECEQDGQ